MKHFSWKLIFPHLIAVGVFLIVALIYCKPALEGKVLQQSDIVHWKGMAQSAFEYKEKNGHFPLWNTHLFSGMPNYQVAMEGKGFLPDLNKLFTLGLPKPASFFFLACICFYILSSVLGVNFLIGILGSLAFSYATYDPVIISVGHETKMMAIAYMPALLAGLLLLYQKRYIIGMLVTTVFATMEIASNHPQISYYFLIVVGIMTIAYIIRWIKAGEWKHMFIALSLALVGGFVGVANSAIGLMTTYEYSKFTMRGGKSIDIGANNEIKKVNTKGLDKDYAFSWSIAKSEALTLFMPYAFGGSSGETFDENSKIVSSLTDKNIPEGTAMQLASNLPKYWGGLEGTSGPVYLGAIICLLFAVGMVVVKNEARWWILAATLFGIFMAWGKYFSSFNEILFQHLPMYNKFRAPSMSLVIPQLLAPLMAVLALQAIFFEAKKEELKKQYKKMLYALASLFVLGALVYLFNDFRTSIDEQVIKAYTNPQDGNNEIGRAIVNAMMHERKGMIGAGLMRILLYGALVFSLIWLYTKNILKPVATIVILMVVNTIDLLVIDSKYLNSDNYMEPDSYQSENFTPSEANKEIFKDTDPHFRVLSLAPDRFNESITSYFHRNIGGYHAAKLRIYQDLIEGQLSKERPDGNHPALNMLDTRYFIVPAQEGRPAMVHRNEGAMGPAWFVQQIQYVDGPIEEMKALDSLNPRTTAIVDKSFASFVPKQLSYDSTARIQLVNYDNDHIKYTTQAATEQFAVLSEVYYPAGWNAYLDGKKVDYCKTNYVLRGIIVPAGQHQLEFKFEPASYHNGQTLAYIGNALIWLCILLSVILFIKKQRNKIPETTNG